MSPLAAPRRDEPPRRIEGDGTPEADWLSSPGLDAAPWELPSLWARRHRVTWVVSPHPDDEVLALGGTLRAMARDGARIVVVSVSDGEASHPESTRWSPAALADSRPLELATALARLHVPAEVVRLRLPDGDVARDIATLQRFLAERLTSRDALFAPHRRDGHRDHEAAGETALDCARDAGATAFEFPVWLWHWARPDEPAIAWRDARRIAIDDELDAKRRAIAAFASQVEPDGARGPILPDPVLARFTRPFETVFAVEG